MNLNKILNGLASSVGGPGDAPQYRARCSISQTTGPKHNRHFHNVAHWPWGLILVIKPSIIMKIHERLQVDLSQTIIKASFLFQMSDIAFVRRCLFKVVVSIIFSQKEESSSLLTLFIHQGFAWTRMQYHACPEIFIDREPYVCLSVCPMKHKINPIYS